jgi:acyl-CoA reductase-like NAD-dependent aldehyde dehydrogenase
MAVVAVDRALPIGDEWVETGDRVEVRSPFSGEPVGRVAKAGIGEARRAIDAAERAMREPLAAHARAAILERVAELLAERHEDMAGLVALRRRNLTLPV